MPEPRNTVVPQIAPVDEEKFRHAFKRLLHRLAAAHGDARLALALGVSERQLRNIFAGSIPGVHGVWNLLALDPTALDEIADLYGMRVTPARAEPGKDFDTIARLANCAGQYVSVMADGIRDHRETLELAESARPLISRLSAIVAEADHIRGAPR